MRIGSVMLDGERRERWSSAAKGIVEDRREMVEDDDCFGG